MFVAMKNLTKNSVFLTTSIIQIFFIIELFQLFTDFKSIIFSNLGAQNNSDVSRLKFILERMSLVIGSLLRASLKGRISAFCQNPNLSILVLMVD